MLGRIVILTGAPRSGKSSLARAVQQACRGGGLPGASMRSMPACPRRCCPASASGPGASGPISKPVVRDLYAAGFDMMAALAGQGFDVVADLSMHADYASPFDPFEVMRTRLAGLPLFVVGVRCDLDVILERRSRDTDARHVPLGAEAPAPVQRWQTIHEGRDYDLELDMGLLSPEAGAARLAEALHDRLSD